MSVGFSQIRPPSAIGTVVAAFILSSSHAASVITLSCIKQGPDLAHVKALSGPSIGSQQESIERIVKQHLSLQIGLESTEDYAADLMLQVIVSLVPDQIAVEVRWHSNSNGQNLSQQLTFPAGTDLITVANKAGEAAAGSYASACKKFGLQ